MELKKANTVFVIRDDLPVDVVTREVEGRRYVWVTALARSLAMLHAAVRSHTWSIAEGSKPYSGDEGYRSWRKTQPDYSPDEAFDHQQWTDYRFRCADDFPALHEGFEIADSMRQMGAITFLTVFNKGYAAPGLVAGNFSAEVDAFREKCVCLAFPDPSERNVFDSLLQRIKSVRDGLLAHSDGEMLQMAYEDAVSTFRSTSGAVTPEDAVLLYGFAKRLFDVVRWNRFG